MSFICLRRVRSFASVPAERGVIEDSRYAPGHVVNIYNLLQTLNNNKLSSINVCAAQSRLHPYDLNSAQVVKVTTLRNTGATIKQELSIVDAIIMYARLKIDCYLLRSILPKWSK
jgi:hypothetical protein